MGEPRTERLIAVLSGPVSCARQSGASPGVTLQGVSAEAPGERLILSFSGAGEADLPATLDGARVLALHPQRYRIESPPRHWVIRACAVHLHRDARAAFFKALPPRRARLTRRLFWRVVLGLARRRIGLRLLAGLRER